MMKWWNIKRNTQIYNIVKAPANRCLQGLYR
jgi:hypothetical protein